MDIVFVFLLFIAGFIIILKGSDLFVDSAVWAAEVFRIPQIFIGATIISICTTLPETFISVTAALSGETDMAFGNAFGSILVNLGLILSTLIIFSTPKIDDRKSFIHNSIFLITITLVLWISGFIFNSITRLSGLFFIVLFIIYMVNNLLNAKKLLDFDIIYDIEDEEHVIEHYDPSNPMPYGISYDEMENDFDISRQALIRNLIYFIIGIGLVIIGSHLLVVNGVQLAQFIQVPTIFIALFFTSIGTSIPELITVITSARKGAVNLGVGNILGASILNILQVLSISAIAEPIPLRNDTSILFFIFPFTILMILAAAGFGILNKGRYKSWNGFVLLAFYLIFLIVNINIVNL